MKLFKIKDVPEFLRPFFPLFPEEDKSTQLVLTKDESPHKYMLLVLALLNLLCSIVFSSIIYFTGFIAFSISFIVNIIAERYQKIEITPSGITLIRKLLFFRFTSHFKKEDIQSIGSYIKKWNEEIYNGRLTICLVNSKKYSILEFSRKGKIEMEEDINALKTKLNNVLSIHNGRKTTI